MSPRKEIRRRKVVQAVGGMALLGGGAGCASLGGSSDDSPENEEPTPTDSQMDSSDDADDSQDGDTNHQSDDDHDESGDSHDENHGGGDGHDTETSADVETLQQHLAETVDTPSDAVTIGLGFLDSELPVDLALYEPADAAVVGETEFAETDDHSTLATLREPAEELAAVETDQLSLQYFQVTPGTPTQLALVGETPEPASFIAKSPEIEVSDDTEIDYDCYCHQTYTLDSEGTWARVIEFRVAESSETGNAAAGVYSVTAE